MLFFQHLFVSILPFLVIFYFDIVGAFIFLAVNLILDFDHYLAYVLRFKKFKGSYEYFTSIRGVCEDFFIFHSVEFILLVFVLSYYFDYLLYVFLGLLVHVLSDVYDSKKRKVDRYFLLVKWIRKEIYGAREI